MIAREILRPALRHPGFLLIAAVTFGCGIAATTTMWALLDAIIHPYVPYRAPDELFAVELSYDSRLPLTPEDLRELVLNRTRSFADAATATVVGLPLDSDDPEPVGVALVAPEFFRLLGVSPRMGRVFATTDPPQVALVGESLWRRQFAGRSRLDGATLTVGGQVYAVIGVMPRGMSHPGPALVWLPLPPATREANVVLLQLYVRLRTGVTRAKAQDELTAAARALTIQFGAQRAPFAFRLEPLIPRREQILDIHWALTLSAIAVLVVACANLAELMLAHALARGRELAIRMAVGASRGRIVGLLFADCLVVVIVGATLGTVASLWGADILTSRMSRSVPWLGLIQPRFSGRVLLATLATVATSAMAFGLLPALRVARNTRIQEQLNDGAGAATRLVRMRYHPLVIGEVALALVLVMGGVLLARSVWQLSHETLNFPARGLYTVSVWTQGSASGPRSSNDIVRLVASGVRGVRDAATVSTRRPPGAVVTAERSERPSGTLIMPVYRVVTPNYLRVVGLPVLRGRDFEVGDGAAGGPGAVMLDSVAAARLYPDQNPVGRMVSLGAAGSGARWIRVVGVVRNPGALDEDHWIPQPLVLLAGADSSPSFEVVVRAETAAVAVAAVLQREISALPQVVGVHVQRFTHDREEELESRRFMAVVFLVIGCVALLLAGIGLHSVLLHATGERMREYAVRSALGSAPGATARLVVHDGMVMLLAGVGLGAVACLGLTRLLDALLVTIAPWDAVSLVLSEGLVVAAGCFAMLGPARLAGKADPLQIIRAA